MRRNFYIILFFLVLIAPFMMRLVLVKGSSPASEVSGDVINLVVVSPHNDDIRSEFSRAFSQWYRTKYSKNVKLDFRTVGTSDVKRLIENTYREIKERHGNALPADETQVRSGLDVVWGGGDFTFDRELKPMGVLRPLEIDPNLMAEVFPQPTLAGVKLYDQAKDTHGKLMPPQWVGVCLSSFGIVYNQTLYDVLGLPYPATWSDLTHPKLAGLISLADPAHSGSAAVVYMMVIQRGMADAEIAYFNAHPDLKAKPKAEWSNDAGYNQAIAAGWKQGLRTLTQIAANTRYFTDSSTIVPNDVGNGEAAAGVAIDFYGRVTSESFGKDRCQFVSPKAATAITPDPIAILYGTTGEKLVVANRLIEFLLSRQGQLLWTLKPGQPDGPMIRSLRRPPIRFDLYGPGADHSGWSDDMNPYSDAGGFNQRGEWMAALTDLRFMWICAWVDDREALLDSYHQLLKLPASMSEFKIAKLIDIPLEMTDLLAFKKEREAIEREHGDIDKWKASKRIEWSKKFAQHYRTIVDGASGSNR